MFHYGKGAVEVDGEGGAPLLVGHGVDVTVVRQPDAVVDDQRIERPEALDGGAYQSFGSRGASEVHLHGVTKIGSTFRDELLGFGMCAHVIEDDTGPGADEQALRRGADAARASG